jgi:outer membrane protein
MKKILIIALLMSMSVFSFALKLGTVDTQLIMQKYSGTQNATKLLNNEKDKMQKDVDVKAKELEKLSKDLQAKGDKISKEDKENYAKQEKAFKQYYQMLQQNLEQLKYKEYSKVSSDIDTAIKQVAKKEKYEYVFEAGAVKFGGEDITEKVLKFLEKSEKIDL